MKTPSPQNPSGFRLTMDPIKFEVMRNAFTSAAEEMAAALRKTAYSTNIKTRADFSCALFDSQIRSMAQSFSQPMHLGGMSRFVPAAIRQYGVGRLKPGDGIVMNHPHHGAMHLNDIAIIVPFFYNGKHEGYSATIAHHVDIGGMAPGGLCMSRDVYQEGIIIPATKLIQDDRILDEVFNLITANIRSPRQMGGDFRAQVAAALLGKRRIAEIIDRFGLETVGKFTEELTEYTRSWTKAEISKLPEGEYHAEGFLDNDGVTDRPIKLVVHATVKGGRIAFDLAGTDPQRPSPMNANLTYMHSALSYVVKCLLSPDIPVNEGFYSQLEFSAPKGTVVSSGPPCGVVGGAEVSVRVCDLAFRAFADGMRKKIPACGKSTMCQMSCGGVDPKSGDYYAFYETLAGGYGGRPNKDGLDAVQVHFQNTENSAIEEIENQYPMRILCYELVADSEGAGKYRGGLGMRRDYRFLDHEVTFTILSESAKFAPWGLWGGGSGAKARFILNPDGENKGLPAKSTLVFKPNSVVSFRTPGAGGFGPAIERAPESVLVDAIDGKVSHKRVRTVYGVVVDYKKRKVDREATRRLRRKMANAGARN